MFAVPAQNLHYMPLLPSSPYAIPTRGGMAHAGTWNRERAFDTLINTCFAMHVVRDASVQWGVPKCEMGNPGGYDCPTCKGFKNVGICSHVLAINHITGKIDIDDMLCELCAPRKRGGFTKGVRPALVREDAPRAIRYVDSSDEEASVTKTKTKGKGKGKAKAKTKTKDKTKGTAKGKTKTKGKGKGKAKKNSTLGVDSSEDEDESGGLPRRFWAPPTVEVTIDAVVGGPGTSASAREPTFSDGEGSDGANSSPPLSQYNWTDDEQ